MLTPLPLIKDFFRPFSSLQLFLSQDENFRGLSLSTNIRQRPSQTGRKASTEAHVFLEEDRKPGQERRVQLGFKGRLNYKAPSVLVTKFSSVLGI